MKFIYEFLKVIVVCAMLVFVFAAGWFLSPMGVQSILPDKEVIPSIPRMQTILGVTPDGIIGPITIEALYENDRQKQKVEFNEYAEVYFK